MLEKILIMCDNTSVINLVKNPIIYYITKHIDLKHHFVCDHIDRNDITLNFIKNKF